jgi:hypothetical protein
MESFGSFLDNFMMWCFLSFFIAVGGGILLAFGIIRKNKKQRNFGVIGLVQLPVSVCLFFLFSWLLMNNVRESFLSELNLITEIRCDNLVLDQVKQDSLIQYLNGISNFNTQSTSVKRNGIKIELDAPDKTWKLRFELDSKTDDVVWVYVENISSTLGTNGIGKIKSDRFFNLINSQSSRRVLQN